MNIAIIGASGGIGGALVDSLTQNNHHTVYAISRSPIQHHLATVNYAQIDYNDEHSIQQAAEYASSTSPLDLVIVATGVLHTNTMAPEKALRQLNPYHMAESYLVNTIGPALVAKHFLPRMHRKQRAVFAALSARVGSIADNRLGGWYAYRASKAALNMLIKTTSIEIARSQKNCIVVGLHPGTVATKLSGPFQARVAKEKLFATTYAAKKLLTVVERLTPLDSGKIFAWDGDEIPY